MHAMNLTSAAVARLPTYGRVSGLSCELSVWSHHQALNPSRQSPKIVPKEKQSVGSAGSDWTELMGVRGEFSGCLGRIFCSRRSSPFLTRAGILVRALSICLRSER